MKNIFRGKQLPGATLYIWIFPTAGFPADSTRTNPTHNAPVFFNENTTCLSDHRSNGGDPETETAHAQNVAIQQNAGNDPRRKDSWKCEVRQRSGLGFHSAAERMRRGELLFAAFAFATAALMLILIVSA